MSKRVSQIQVTALLLDEFDAPSPTEPVVFSGDAAGSAIEKAKEFLDELEERLQLDGLEARLQAEE